jgi:ketosteroid isomerase-like protein
MSHHCEELLERFYAAFDRRDGDAMAACYTHDAHFSDPVFTDLHGAQPGQMWRMLTANAQDLRVELLSHSAEVATGSARWRADYVFSQTGRNVTNEVHSTFRFRDGLIADQVDDFSFWRWSRQALGPPGVLIGWTPFLRNPVRRRAAANLAAYSASA